ncbi:MAG TPA: CHAP domain-containing protein [Clostridia bacterium]|nr:CHAP domain-containing protein [Clostridia bacterium]
MQQTHRIGKGALSLLLITLMLLQFGCVGETVHALDYSLESELYTDQPVATPQPAEQTPAQPGTASETPTPAPTPTPINTISPTPTQTSATMTPTNTTPTPTPQGTSAGTETPLPSQTPELHRLTILVQDASAAPLIGARVMLFQDGSVLFSGMTGSDGNVSWTLALGHSYRVKAALSGYVPSDGDDKTYDMAQDVAVKITLVQGTSGETGTTTPTPLPVPEGAPGKVLITADDVSIQPKQAGFGLLDGVRAQTELGQPVAVWVVDKGGFSAETPGSYTVTYGAFEEGKLITATRTVTVEGATEETAPQDQPHAPFGSSKERYEILMAYRAEIGDQLSERIAALTEEYKQKVAEAQAANGESRILAPSAAENDTDDMTTAAKDVQQTQEVRVTNWPDVLATFLAQNVANEDRPLNQYELMDIPLDRLDSVFWDMNPIEVFRMDGTANVLLNAKSYEDMADVYGMSANRRTFLYELMQPEFQRTFASMTGNTAFFETSKEGLGELLDTLPGDTNVERKQVVETAFSLVGKISYVFGGKYNRLGWNNAWGNANEAEEGDKVRISRDDGLDCSGFVSWVFINALGDPAALRVIGNGSSNQWAHSEAIGWDEGKPGDLAFYCAPGERQYNHVGVIVAVDDDGSYLIAHCSSVQDGVVVTDGWSTGFRYLRRPAFFQ